MFCKRKYLVDPSNKEHVKRMNNLLLGRKFQFVVGEGNDVLKGWCEDVRVEPNSFLVLTGVILDVTKKAAEHQYQEHSELRFFNMPFAAFVNEAHNGTSREEEVEEE
jgi:hypothetical protein